MSWVTGVGLTSFGRHEGQSSLDLMTTAAAAALADSGLARKDIDGLVCGYATTMPHIMLSTLFAEHFGLQPRYAHAVQLGRAAFIISREPVNAHSLRIRGCSQAHTHQHVTAALDLTHFGARASMERAMAEAGIGIGDVGYAAVYDSFTITLAILLEEIGLCPRGQSGRVAASGHFSTDGAVPLNTHGGLLSYDHCGVAGALAHLAEAHLQLTRRAGARQIPGEPAIAMLHGDGGIMSSHVSMIMERSR